MNAVHTLQGQRTAHGVQQADDEAYISSVKGARPAATACTRLLNNLRPPCHCSLYILPGYLMPSLWLKDSG